MSMKRNTLVFFSFPRQDYTMPPASLMTRPQTKECTWRRSSFRVSFPWQDGRVPAGRLVIQTFNAGEKGHSKLCIQAPTLASTDAHDKELQALYAAYWQSGDTNTGENGHDRELEALYAGSYSGNLKHTGMGMIRSPKCCMPAGSLVIRMRAR